MNIIRPGSVPQRGLFSVPAGNQSKAARENSRRMRKAARAAKRASNKLGAVNFPNFIAKTENIYDQVLNRSLLVDMIAGLDSATYTFLEQIKESYTTVPMLIDFTSATNGGWGGLTQSWAYSAMIESADDAGDQLKSPYAAPMYSKRYRFGYFVGYYLVNLCQSRDSGSMTLVDILEVLAGRKRKSVTEDEQRGARFAAWLILKLPELFPVGVFGKLSSTGASTLASQFGGMVVEWMDDSEYFDQRYLYSFPALYGFSALAQLSSENLPISSFNYLGAGQSTVGASAATTSSLGRIMSQMVATDAGLRFFQNTASVGRSDLFNRITKAGADVAKKLAKDQIATTKAAYLDGKLIEAEKAKGGKLTDAEKTAALERAKAEYAAGGVSGRNTGAAKEYANTRATNVVEEARKTALKEKVEKDLTKIYSQPNPPPESDRDALRAELEAYHYMDVKFLKNEKELYDTEYNKALTEWGSTTDKNEQKARDKKKEEVNTYLDAVSRTGAATSAVSNFIGSASAAEAAKDTSNAANEQYTKESEMTNAQIISAIGDIASTSANIGMAAVEINASVPPPVGTYAAIAYTCGTVGLWIGTSAATTIYQELTSDPEYHAGSDSDYKDISASNKLGKRYFDQAYMVSLYCWTALNWIAGDGTNYQFRTNMISDIKQEFDTISAKASTESERFDFLANFKELADQGFLPQILDGTIVLINKNNSVFDPENQTFIGPDGPFVRADKDGELCVYNSDCPTGKICVGYTCKPDPNYKGGDVDPPKDYTKLALILGGMSLALIVASVVLGRKK